jgi:hypothetical protein
MSMRRAEQVDDYGVILFCDDSALQLGGVLIGLDTPTGTVPLDSADTFHLPAALFEFERSRVTASSPGRLPPTQPRLGGGRLPPRLCGLPVRRPTGRSRTGRDDRRPVHPKMRQGYFRHGCATGLTVGGLVTYITHR